MWLCYQIFAEYIIIFIRSPKFSHWALMFLTNIWNITETAMLHFLASLGNKTSVAFDFCRLLDVLFPFFPMLLKRFWNCFISLYVFFKQPLKYYLPMKYEGCNKPKWIMYTTKNWLYELSRGRFQLHVHLECEYIFYIQKHPQCCFCLAEIES